MRRCKGKRVKRATQQGIQEVYEIGGGELIKKIYLCGGEMCVGIIAACCDLF